MRISAIPNTTNIPRRADLQGIVNGFTQVSGLDLRFNRLDFFWGGCSYSLVNPNSPIRMGNWGMLARAPEGRIVLMRRTGLRDVRNLVPHDRVNHLEPLSRDGLQRLAVRHASGAAARVVLAPSAIGSGEAVA